MMARDSNMSFTLVFFTFSLGPGEHKCMKKNIRIYHECEGRIEKSVLRIAV